jgi:hypothetical protein
MDLDKIITDLTGLTIIVVGLLSLSESLLQVSFIGERLPFVQGTVISLFTVSFGAVLLTENASRAFRKLRLKSRDLLRSRGL